MRCWLPVLWLFAVLAAGCGSEDARRARVEREPQSGPGIVDKGTGPPDAAQRNEPHAGQSAIQRLDAKVLPNLVRVHERVVSGGAPEGDVAFAELAELGFKTVISVDGAVPDVHAAARHGLRYVHLPHGYDGVSNARAQELAKAVRDLPGPIYIHCHHGQHRSPAAAAVACVGAGLIDHKSAALVLELAGTSESYRGLFQSVAECERLDPAVLDQLPAEFPAVAKLPAMAEAMVAIERTYDHLQAIQRAGWKTPDDKPDLIPAHEALLLREHFAELLRTPELQAECEEFRRLAEEAELLARALEDTFTQSGRAATIASQKLEALDASCKNCHQKFRDVPLYVGSPKPTI